MNIGFFGDLFFRINLKERKDLHYLVNKFSNIYINDFDKEYDIAFLYIFNHTWLLNLKDIKAKYLFVFKSDFFNNLNYLKDKTILFSDIEGLPLSSLDLNKDYEIYSLFNKIKLKSFYKYDIENWLNNTNKSDFNKQLYIALSKNNLQDVKNFLDKSDELDDISFLFNLAILYIKLSDLDKAERILFKLIDIVKNKEESFTSLNIYLDSLESISRYNYYKKDLKKFIFIEVVFLLNFIYISKKDFKKSLDVFLDYNDYLSSDFDFKYNMAIVLFSNGRSSASIDTLFSVINSVKFDVYSLINLVSILVFIEKEDIAISLVDEIKKIPDYFYNEDLKKFQDENLAILYLKLAKDSFYKKDYLKAKDYVLKSLDYKKMVEALDIAGVIYLQQARPFKALSLFKEALSFPDKLDIIDKNIKYIKKFTKLNFVIFSVSKNEDNLFSLTEYVKQNLENIRLLVFIYNWDKKSMNKVKYLKDKKINYFYIDNNFSQSFKSLFDNFTGLYSFFIQDNYYFEKQYLDKLIDFMEEDRDKLLFSVSALTKSHYNKHHLKYNKEVFFVSSFFTLSRNEVFKSLGFNFKYKNHFYLFEDLTLTAYSLSVKSMILKDLYIKVLQDINYKKLKAFKESEKIFLNKFSKIKL